MNVIKRSGEEVVFDASKIENAIKKANKQYNRFSFWAGFIDDLSAGVYSDFEVDDESLFLYYR